MATELIPAPVSLNHLGPFLSKNVTLQKASSPDGKRDALNRCLRELKGYCREVFVATDHIQRTWGYIRDIDAMLLIMYQHLNDIYPPRFLKIFKELFPEEWQTRGIPKLL